MKNIRERLLATMSTIVFTVGVCASGCAGGDMQGQASPDVDDAATVVDSHPMAAHHHNILPWEHCENIQNSTDAETIAQYLNGHGYHTDVRLTKNKQNSPTS